ncbi:glycosyltransferase [Bacteroides sp. AN502(2024)]|uniref:glycosyltransferase n=1 Tax=Bacteroides sp. AN502(2024) TaxID=3160599 RepID=UPI00351834D1
MMDQSMEIKIESSGNSYLAVAMLMQSGEAGGVQRIMINLAKGLIIHGVNVSFLIGDARGEMMQEIPSCCEIINFNKKFYRGDAKLLGALYGIYNYMHSHPNTVILAAPGLAGTLTAFIKVFCRRFKVISIVDNRCTLLKGGSLYHKVVYCLNKSLFGYLNAIIAAHSLAKEEQIKCYNIPPSRVYKIYHPLISPIAIENTAPETEHPFIKARKYGVKLMLAVGRLVPEKDFATLLKAFNKVRQNKDARLIILGDGPLRKGLEEIRQSSRYADDIDLLGYTNNVIGFMKSADLFVLSSKEEAFGNVLIEAMSCGLPCVATDCASGGPRDIMEGGDKRYGALCPCQDSQALAEGILSTLDRKYDSCVIKKRAEVFTIAHSAGLYLKVIKKLVNDLF